MRTRLAAAAAALLLALLPGTARAQRLAVGDPLEDYLRVLQVAGRATPGSFTIRPLSLDRALASLAADSANPWSGRIASPAPSASLGAARLVLTDPFLRLFENTAYPSGQNDGAVWQGRGLTAALDAGGALRWGPLTIELRPTLIYTQNQAFPLAQVVTPGRTIYANPWHPRGSQTSSIDLPQRFGPDAFWTLDPGQSSIRLDVAGFEAGFGTENLWWGPGVQNAIMMSDNAPGFPHAWLATARPRDIGIGKLEAQWVWGRLQQTKWSDSVPTDTARFFTGAVFTLEPKLLPGLFLGASRLFYEDVPPSGLVARDYFLIFDGVLKKEFVSATNPHGDDARDQILSVFARWVLPASGFEAYAEWARNDHSWDLRDFILEPEHSQAYTLGFQKVLPASGGRLVRLGGELTHLERDITQLQRATPPYYVHYLVRAGYTERGQVIGAGVGPGGNAQRLTGDLFTTWGRIGGFVGRQVHDNDAFYAVSPDFDRHWVELLGGVSALVFRGGVDVGGTLTVSRHLNRYYVLRNDATNLSLQLSVRWRPGDGRAAGPSGRSPAAARTRN